MKIRSKVPTTQPVQTMDNKEGSPSRSKRALASVCLLFLLGAIKIFAEKTLLRKPTNLRHTETDLDFLTTNKTLLWDREEKLILMGLEHEEDQKNIADLQEELKVKQEKMTAMMNLQERTRKELESAVATAEKAAAAPPLPSVFETNEICSYLPSSERISASRLWQKYIPEILEAAHNAQVPESETEEVFAQYRKLLEETITPARLRRAVRHTPTFSHRILKHVFGIVEKRIQDPINNPPLKIAVFGGSVTIGRECKPKRMSYKPCAWPQRFALLINQFFRREIVTVYNLGVGGTGSNTGTNRVKFWMYDERELKQTGPDVIINSYSTNDSLPPFDKKWPEHDLINIVTDTIRKNLQDFVREALQSKPCLVPPLVVHVDDYLGPQQPALLGELSYVSAMTQLAKYYDTVGISYGEVVRDLFYEDQTDATFANSEDVHYGHFAHQTIAWSVGFASLELLLNYCDDEYIARIRNSPKVDNANGGDMILTKDDIRKQKLYLPPPLDREFLLEDATKRFDAAVTNATQFYIENNCAAVAASGEVKKDMNPCIVTWISTPGNFNSKKIAAFMRKNTIANDGWRSERQSAEGWSNKDGWVADKANASFTLQFENINKSVKTVSFFFLRSYGDKWKDSRARFTVARIQANGDTKVVAQKQIAGVHDSDDFHYSLTLSESINLSERVTEGETVQIKVDLVSGTTFKIMGMMVCNK